MIEEFVTRSGTDYGAQEPSIEEKIADVEQLDFGEVIIVFNVGRARNFNPSSSIRFSRTPRKRY